MAVGSTEWMNKVTELTGVPFTEPIPQDTDLELMGKLDAVIIWMSNDPDLYREYLSPESMSKLLNKFATEKKNGGLNKAATLLYEFLLEKAKECGFQE